MKVIHKYHENASLATKLIHNASRLLVEEVRSNRRRREFVVDPKILSAEVSLTNKIIIGLSPVAKLNSINFWLITQAYLKLLNVNDIFKLF